MLGSVYSLFLNLPAGSEINKELYVRVVSNFGRFVYIHVGWNFVLFRYTRLLVLYAVVVVVVGG